MQAFDPHFIEEVGDWTVGVAAFVAVVGAIITRRPGFAVTCAAGAALDILTLRAIAHRAGTGSFGTDIVPIFLGRLLGKVSIVLLAFMIPVLDAAGAVAGVLVVDMTLLTVGPVVAARRAFGGGSANRKEEDHGGD